MLNHCYKAALLQIIWLIPASTLYAQNESAFSMDASIGIASQNIWRGYYQAGASIQPETSVSYERWEFTAWGSSAADGKDMEIDLTLEYSLKNLSFGITDYWSGLPEGNYRDGHILELSISYGFGNIPLSIIYNTVVAGDNGNLSGYLEVSYRPSWKEWSFDITAGMSPYNNKILETGRISFTDLSIGIGKDLKFSTVFTAECFTKLIYNPDSDSLFWVAGINIPL